ncbi:hypothetical protein [Rhizobium lentis]|uniref:Uncharacterized protein n=1 Tax=Rhizobium lentis TaxID=1138194 RepID=A0A7W8XG28_9HYPH|nr:hypothetical protein [Rhizobium lentis]MBB4575005.1 hypothetical protein [Rhizobium lentis]MBB5551314.1 hypothetical protein [Rhizobium lentis]MBB5562190.1 hypothetical protein [Rhizobium lentis]MBB5568773.1 hypothetical protein [Rhizobium lentis]
MAKARASRRQYRLFTFIRQKVMVYLKRVAIFQVASGALGLCFAHAVIVKPPHTLRDML